MSIKAKIASLVVELAANAASFNEELRRSRAEAGDWAEGVKTSAKAGAAVVAVASTASAAALAMLTAEAMANIDAMAKHADKLGMTTEALAGLRHQAELNGVAADALDDSLQSMVERLSEAAQGTGEGAEALAALGLQVSNLRNLRPDQQFAVIAESMNKLENQSDKVRIAIQLFGDSGAGLVNAMRGGPEALAAAAAEAESLGLAVSRVDAAKIEAANDASDRAAKVFTGLGNTLAIAVAPYIEEVQKQFVDSAKASNGFKDTVDDGMNLVAIAVGGVADVVNGLSLVWKGAELLVAKFAATGIKAVKHMRDSVVDFINIIPGVNVEIDQNSGLALWADVASQQVSDLSNELKKAALAPPPSVGIAKAFKEIAEQAEIAAKKSADAAKTNPGNGNDVLLKKLAESLQAVESELQTSIEKAQQTFDRRQSIVEDAFARQIISEQKFHELSQRNEAEYQQAIQKLSEGSDNSEKLRSQLEAVQSELQTQLERVQENYEQRQAVIDAALQQQLLTEQQYQQLSQRNEADHQAALLALRSNSDGLSLQQSADFFANLATMAEAANGRQSRLFKISAAANALIKTYEGATSAYAAMAPIPVVGPALGVAAAGAAITMGMANVAAINAVGMAHDGIDTVPKTGTWILEEGERVTTAKTSAKLDATLDQITKDNKSIVDTSTKPPDLIVNNHAYTDGYTVRRREIDAQTVIDIVAADTLRGGQIDRANRAAYGSRRRGK